MEWLESLRRNCGSQEEFDKTRTQPICTQFKWTTLVHRAIPLSLSSCTSSTGSVVRRLAAHPQGEPTSLPTPTERPTADYKGYPRRRHGCPVTLGGKLSDPDSCKFYVAFGDWLKAGHKIDGGGQADIHEAIYYGKAQRRFVLKVFTGGSLPTDLHCIWSKAGLSYVTLSNVIQT